MRQEADGGWLLTKVYIAVNMTLKTLGVERLTGIVHDDENAGLNLK
jgi:hypothetical protein